MPERAGVIQRFGIIVVGMALIAAFLGAYGNTKAEADHEPANKVAAAGTSIENFDDATPILEERVRTSTVADLILSVTLECSILTELTTGGDDTGGATDSAEAEGRVDIWIEIDGKVVPIATDDDQAGRVTFCNRQYHRDVTDAENPQDGLDEEHDFIRTKDANAFNWLAINTGSTFDSPENGNNILDIVVWADYITSTAGEATADAFVGARTLIVEPTNASVHEAVAPAGQ